MVPIDKDGGWVIEAATNRPRPHEDTEVAILRADVGHALDNLSSLDFWEWSDVSGPQRGRHSSPECRQLWVRANADSPWLPDLLPTP